MNKSKLNNLVISAVTGVNRVQAKAFTVTPRRNRACSAIAIKIEGETIYESGGRRILSNKENLVLLPKGSNYTWESHGGVCLMIDFESNLTDETILSFSVKDVSGIENLFIIIENDRIARSQFFELKNIGLLYKLILMLIESDRKKYVPIHKENIIKPAMNYISENYADSELDITHLSELCGISSVYFRKLFFAVYACPPKQYIQRLRMTKASEMLKSDYNTITSVALSVGYTNIYHFSKMFRRHFGVAPSEYGKRADACPRKE